MNTKRDLVVARVCLEKGYATPEQVEECLKEASSASQTARPVEAVLRKQGYISEEAYRELAAVEGRSREPSGGEAPPRCARCGTAYTGDLCPTCVAGFALAADSSEGGGAPEGKAERPPLPLDPEIEKAVADPGNRFGKYVLLRELGAGGMGVVFKAWQTDLRRLVALKFIRGVEAQEDLERFFREAQLAATLSHPAIAPIYESGVHDGKHFFAMQYVEGMTLDRWVATAPRPPIRQAVDILARVAEAVEYAHEHGIIHRDLKPANVMVDRRGRAYVMDFGLAKSVRTGSSLTGTGFAVGTPSYMSPEQAQGETDAIGPRSDIYALGAILYEIGTGRPPFLGENAVQVLMDVVHRDPVSPRRLNPKLHPELETVTLRALEKDPARRYPTAQEFGADLGRWLVGEPVLARPVGTLSRLVRKIRKHKLALAGGVAILAGLSLAVGTWAFRAREKWTRSDAKPYYEEAASLFDQADKVRFLSKPSEDALTQYRSQLRQAEKNALSAVTRDPGFAEAYFLLGKIHRLQLSYPRSEADLGRAITLDPGHLRAYLERAMLRLEQLAIQGSFETIMQRTSTRLPQFTWTKEDPGSDRLRAQIREDLEAAGRLAGREYEKALLRGANELVLWRPGPLDGLRRAEEHLLRARSLMANDPVPLRLLSMGRLLQADYSGAADYAAGMIEIAPNDRALLYVAAVTLLYAERHDQALAAVERALRIDPGTPSLLNIRGNLRTRKKDYDGAREDFERALEAEPRNTTLLHNLAYLFHETKRFGDAVATYGRAVREDPEDPDGYEGRSVSNLELGRLEEAEKDMDRVVAARPTSDSYSNRGAIRSRRGRYPEALEDYERALQLSPDNATVHYNLGILRTRRNEQAAAVEAFRRAIELGRVQADGYVALADALIKLRRFAEAEEASTKALALEPGSGTAFADRGQARAAQGRVEEGLEDYLRALERRPDDSGILGDIGHIHVTCHRYAEALPFLRRARDLGKADAGLLLGESLLQMGKFEEAEEAFTRAAKELPKNPFPWFGRGRVRQAQHRREEAIADLDQAVALSPDFAEAIGLRGVLKLEGKRRKEAATDLRRAIELKPTLRRAFEEYLREADGNE
jgi:tetratricopeptide (TPR) repeat protein/predicted Ser/Thr protein kinase